MKLYKLWIIIHIKDLRYLYSGPSSRANASQNNRKPKNKSRPGDPDKVERVKDEVARVKDIMVTNIEALLERGERLDLLVDKTEQLSSNAVTFKQASRTLARRMWWQNFKVSLEMKYLMSFKKMREKLLD